MQTTYDFLPKNVFIKLQNYCYENEFKIIKTIDKDFCLLETPDFMYPYLERTNKELIMTFIKKSNLFFDTELRIHADGLINNQKSDTAAVLYINAKENITRNGTEFFSHHKYKHSLPDNVTDEEFDRLLIEDSKDKCKWCRTNVVYSEPNKLISYDSNMFHSKFPQVIEEGDRIALVAFYK
jgi:hypothetical protein